MDKVWITLTLQNNYKNWYSLGMESNPNSQDSHKERPLWEELVEIELKISKALSKIDASASDFTAQDVVLDQLRKKYYWYNKWAMLNPRERAEWMIEYEKRIPPKILIFEEIFYLAEKNYQTAVDYIARENLSDTAAAGHEVTNIEIENITAQLGQIEKLLQGENIREAAVEFLIF